MLAMRDRKGGIWQNNLAVLTFPYKVSLAFAAALLVHFESVHGDVIGVYFAT